MRKTASATAVALTLITAACRQDGSPRLAGSRIVPSTRRASSPSTARRGATESSRCCTFCSFPKSSILLRGTFEPFDESKARASEADAVLSKPFVPDDLVRAIESAVR